MPLRISAIVPTLNEEGAIEMTLKSLRRAGLDQVIVADGGSTDRTIDRARPLADEVVAADPGLCAQLNQAAAKATGDVLLFHYADVELAEAGRDAIERALERDDVVGGAFTLAFASKRKRYAVIARGASLRNRLGLGPFGDQSIFARADAFHRVGRFDEGAFFGDLDLVRRLRRAGRFVIVPERVQASTRRWEKNGFLSTLASHWWLTLVYVASRGRGTRTAARRAQSLHESR